MSRQSKTVEAVVLLVDVGQTVSQPDSDGQSFLNRSKECASRIIQRKIFSAAVDQFSLILIGSEKTDNELEYPNINVKYKWLISPNWNMLKDIESLSATSVSSGDWLDGIIVAINLLKNETEAKKFTELKIVMMSNFATPLRAADQVDDVIETIKDLKINLVVIGPKSEDDNDSSADLPLKSKTQRKGEIIIGRIVDEAEGVMFEFHEVMSQLDHFSKIVGRSQPWYCDIQIGPNIFIPVVGFKKISPKSLLKWIKRSVENTTVANDSVYFQGDKEIEKTDVIKSYLFGQTVVPISGDDKTSLSLTTEKCCQVIGFTKKLNVPRHILMGDTVYYIGPQDSVKASKVAVTALVKALLELEMVAIVRKVYRKNSAPRIGALIPTLEQKSYFFYYVALPFAEDDHFTRLPSLNKVQPTQAQLDAVDQLIDDMDLSQFEEDEDPYRKLVDPSVEHTNNMIIFKAMHPNSSLPKEPSEAVKQLMQPKLEVIENASSTLGKIKRLFQLEELEQKTYRRGAADVFERSKSVEDVKPLNTADSMASFIQSTVTEIGTVDPEGNFLKLLEFGEPFNKLCEQMQTAIKTLFLTSSSTFGAQKPISALTLLRKHCVQQNPSIYNQFIASLKDGLVERDHNEFWNPIVQDKLGLITFDENSESGISAEEAALFYEIKKSKPLSDINYEMEAEDLLDMI